MFDPPWVPQCSGSVQDPINEDQSVSHHESKHCFYSVAALAKLNPKMWAKLKVFLSSSAGKNLIHCLCRAHRIFYMGIKLFCLFTEVLYCISYPYEIE